MGIANKVGTLEPGKLADIVIIDGDPLANLNDLYKVKSVYKSGNLVTLEWLSNLT